MLRFEPFASSFTAFGSFVYFLSALLLKLFHVNYLHLLLLHLNFLHLDLLPLGRVNAACARF